MTDTENPALVRPKLDHPPQPWELTVERDDLHRDCSLALAVISQPDTPGWLRQMAWETYEETAWWLTWGEGREAHAVRLVPLLMHWDGAYQEMTAEFLLDLPDNVKAKYPADVLLAENAAKAADTQGFSIDCRLECLDVLHRILARLKDHADDESPAGEDDIDYESIEFERSANAASKH